MVLAGGTLSCNAAQYYQGYAYASGDHRLLFRESHWLYREDGIDQRLVIYSCADGKPFARKHVASDPGAANPDFDLLDSRTGYREGVRMRKMAREVYIQADAHSPERVAPLPVPMPSDAVADAGFDAFVKAHWDSLSGPGVSPLPFLVPSQLRYLNFSARRLRDEAVGNTSLRWFRLSLSSWYGFVLPHIDIGYDTATHELRQYQGISNIRGAEGHNLDVSVEFPPSELRTDVALADIKQAAAMPLTGQCLPP